MRVRMSQSRVVPEIAQLARETRRAAVALLHPHPPLHVRVHVLRERQAELHRGAPTLEVGHRTEVAQHDLQDVRDADGLFAIVNGTPPDEGVMVELGVAIALGKPTFLFRDDFRRCTDSEDYPLNLMLFAGLPAQGWQGFVYTSLEDICNPAKALAVWARQN